MTEPLALNLGYVVRDMGVQYYGSRFLRDVKVRRVMVLDVAARVALLTTPLRALAVWQHREAQPPGEPMISYLQLTGEQPAVPPPALERFRAVFLAARQGAVRATSGFVEFHAPRLALVNGQVSAGASDSMTVQYTAWLKMFEQNFGSGDSDTAYIFDDIGYKRPNRNSTANLEPLELLLEECESDVAMGSAMKIVGDSGEAVDGIQFRNGYGAKWDAGGCTLEFPCYSPFHRGEADVQMNRVWIFSN